MTENRSALRFDTASAISQGAREYQEDALIADFASGADVSFAVLSDGMGGHAAGDLASKIVVTVVFSELMMRRQELTRSRAACTRILRNAAQAANACIANHVKDHEEADGMGATLVALVIVKDRLYWLSVGDSPLFLFRDNVLQQLNEDHSLGPQIDMMVRSGALTAEEAHDHPERNALTSALLGREIAQVDCPEEAVRLRAGDTLILASDGLQFLEDAVIARILRDRPMCRSSELTDALMDQLDALEDPELDNISMSVIQVRNGMPAKETAQLPFDTPALPLRGWRIGKSKPERSSPSA